MKESKCDRLNCTVNKNGKCQFIIDIGQKPNEKSCPHYFFEWQSAIINRPTTVSIVVSILTVLATSLVLLKLGWL